MGSQDSSGAILWSHPRENGVDYNKLTWTFQLICPYLCPNYLCPNLSAIQEASYWMLGDAILYSEAISWIYR